jgi:hypothetical protein
LLSPAANRSRSLLLLAELILLYFRRFRQVLMPLKRCAALCERLKHLQQQQLLLLLLL